MCRTLLTLSASLALVAACFADEPFNGKDLTGWKLKVDSKKSHWKAGHYVIDGRDPAKLTVGEGPPRPYDLVNTKAAGVDISTEQKYGDCTIEVEFMIPKGSNSGIYVMGEYEVQIFDSFGKEKLGMGDLGAIYSAAAPKVNASKQPGEWQKFVIDFQAPKFEGGKKVANARFLRVELNGTVLHKDVEVKGPTPGGLTGKEAPAGPLMFQGDHGPVAYRNIKITPGK